MSSYVFLHSCAALSGFLFRGFPWMYLISVYLVIGILVDVAGFNFVFKLKSVVHFLVLA